MIKRIRATLAGGLLLCFGLTAQAGPIVYTIDTISDQLYTIDLMTGTSTAIGSVGFGDVEGLSFQPGTGTLFGLDEATNQLITIDTTTGAGTAVGPLGSTFIDSGLAFADNGMLYAAKDNGGIRGFYSVDPATGAATLINGSESRANALAFYNDLMYGISDDGTALITIDLVTGAETVIGGLGITSVDEDGFIIDASGNGYLIRDDIGSGIYSVDLTTGAATFAASYSCTTCRFESAALKSVSTVPEPGTLVLVALGLVAARRWRG